MSSNTLSNYYARFDEYKEMITADDIRQNKYLIITITL